MQVIDKCLQGLGVLAPLSLLVGGALLGEQLQPLQGRQRLRLSPSPSLLTIALWVAEDRTLVVANRIEGGLR